MSRRSVDWNEGLSRDLQKVRFAQEFIRSALEEGLSIQEVLGKVIRAYGVKEFAKKVKVPAPNVLRVVNARHNPTLSSVNQLLKPFGLALSVAPVGRREAA